MKIGILTCHYAENLIEDDHLLVQAFKDQSIEAIPLVWDREQDWGSFDAVFIRSPWDYAVRWDEFKQCLHEISEQTKLIHHLELILWNADKTYLLNIGSDKVRKIPTKHFKKFNQSNFLESFASLSREKIVFKPHVGASGVDTFCVTKDGWADVTNLEGREVLAQPMIESIVSKGEYSFLYFGDKFSHAVRKVPKNGEFRVQDKHGGRVEPYLASEEEIEVIAEFLSQQQYEFTYARVDVAIEPDGFYLMELEVIEPELFFRFSEGGEKLLVESVLKSMNS